MGDVDSTEKIITAEVAGRTVRLRQPNEDQIVAWMGIVGFIASEDHDAEDDEHTKELVGDVTLFLDAMLASFVEDADRKAFRRAVAMGKARLADLFGALINSSDAIPAKLPKKATGVRRA